MFSHTIWEHKMPKQGDLAGPHRLLFCPCGFHGDLDEMLDHFAELLALGKVEMHLGTAAVMQSAGLT